MRLKLPSGLGCTGLAFDQLDLDRERGLAVGQRATYDGGRVSLLEQFMPHFDTRLQHSIEVHAPAQAVFTAVETVTVKEVRFLRESSSYAHCPAGRRLGDSTCRPSTRR